MRVLRVLFGCVWALLFCGCAEEKTYCDGLNESNMPGAIVLVERMDDATRYELDPDDERVSLPDDLSTLISCRDIDGFGKLSFPATIDIEAFEILWTDPINPSSDEYCREIMFAGAVQDGGGDRLEFPSFGRLAGPHYATGMRAEALAAVIEFGPSEWFEEGTVFSSSFLVSSLSKATERFRGSAELRGTGEIYYEDTDDRSPPLIIGRAYSFGQAGHYSYRHNDVPDGLAEYLGVPELQDEGFQCVDLFFGYYEEGD